MTESPGRQSRRVFRLPTRKSVWLYDYDHVKYRTRFQWVASFAAGLVLALIGCMGLWAVVTRFRSGHDIDTALLSLSAMCVAIAVIEVPAAFVYFYRRWRREMTGYFDYEVVNDRGQKGSSGVHHGPDHH